MAAKNFGAAFDDLSDYFANMESSNSDDEIMDEIANDIIAAAANEPERMIQYANKIQFSNNSKPLEISFDDVDKFDFKKKAFVEVITNQTHVHLYFDFDSIKTEDEYTDVIAWLDSLTDVFGPYSIGGYCNNETMKKHGYRLIKGDEHYLSIHVIYYETTITTEDLVSIMNWTKAKGFAMQGVHPLCDPNVYKLVARNGKNSSMQKFRHVLSDKIYDADSPNNKKNHGCILNGNKPSTQIVQIRGNERIITESDWRTLFSEKETKMEARQRAKIEKKEKNFDIDSIEFEDELIEFDRDEMLQFLSHFESHNNDLCHTIAPLYNSPYTKDFLIDVITEWYEQTPHRTLDNIEAIVNSFYHYERSNKWFFSLIKHLPQDTKESYLNRYTRSIDFTININNSTWTLENIRKKVYAKHEFVRLINDLRGVVGFSGNRWCVKQKDDNQVYIKETTTANLREEFAMYKPFRSNTKVNLFQIISKYSRFFLYDSIKVSKDSNDDVINLFTGFKFKEIETDDFTIIEPFLHHIKHIICNDNEDKYTYFMSWWASIFQNITVKNGTMPIIHGAQGSGKSFAVEVFCELIGKYALANCDDMDKVFGKFNGLIARNLVICLNEPPESTDKFKYAGKIKSKLTQKKTVMERKGIDQIEVDSWANYIMTTNNPNPIQEEKGDRRIIYYETNNEMCGNEEYFKNLCKNIQKKKQGEYNPKFMGVLLHYMRTQIDISNWDSERLIRRINNNTNVEYNENLERQYIDLNCVDRYVVDHHQRFIHGLALDDIRVEGYKNTGLARKLASICDVQQMSRKQYVKLIADHPEAYGHSFYTRCEANRVRVYKIKPRVQIPDLYAIIDYKVFNNYDPDEEPVNEAKQSDSDDDEEPVKKSVKSFKFSDSDTETDPSVISEAEEDDE